MFSTLIENMAFSFVKVLALPLLLVIGLAKSKNEPKKILQGTGSIFSLYRE
jgi:hypothetical protein